MRDMMGSILGTAGGGAALETQIAASGTEIAATHNLTSAAHEKMHGHKRHKHHRKERLAFA